MKKCLVTGGCGFIGSNYIRTALDREENLHVVNLDKLTYAGNIQNLDGISSNNLTIVKGDICDVDLVNFLFEKHHFDTVVHFAAESHVDRSIEGPAEFIQTNVVGTLNLLEQSRIFINKTNNDNFRFLHVSTDEVYGSLGDSGSFTEKTPYAPNSPYAASKAASDHLIRSYFKTFGFPTLTTNCSNNYGPHQFPEKLIPLMIQKALTGKPLPVYGDGLHVRDWLYVEDHCIALEQILENGQLGEVYNIGGNNEKTNLEVVLTICEILDKLMPNERYDLKSYKDLIEFVKDRPGHDKRYAIDASKISKELNYNPEESFESGLTKTIKWFLDNQDWCHDVLDSCYHGERLGLFKEN